MEPMRHHAARLHQQRLLAMQAQCWAATQAAATEASEEARRAEALERDEQAARTLLASYASRR